MNNVVRNPDSLEATQVAGRSGMANMIEAAIDRPEPKRRRQIGTIGTTARVVLGLLLLTAGLLELHLTVMNGKVHTGFEPLTVALGGIGFPAVLLAGQWLRARNNPVRLRATGPLSAVLSQLVFFALVLSPLYARPLSFIGYAAMVFYGASMLLAALRGYGGCELLAISNWILNRDDQVGCLIFGPIDDLERRMSGSDRGLGAG